MFERRKLSTKERLRRHDWRFLGETETLTNKGRSWLSSGLRRKLRPHEVVESI